MGEIIVGVDGSESSAEALRWAVEQGRLRGEPIRALLAWDTLDQRYPDRGRRFRSDYAAADAEVALAAYVADAVGADARTVAQRAVAGSAAQVLLDRADGDASMIVVGARGHGALRGAILGSVSLSCAQLAPCPVAVVRHVERRGSDPIGRIVVGVDGSISSRMALDWALDEARASGADVDVVHAWHPVLFGAETAAFTLEGLDETERAAGRMVDALIEEANTDGMAGDVEPVLVPGPVAQRLLEAAKGADLLVVGSRGRGGFSGLLLGSVSHQVAVHADCPVVIAPSHGDER